MAVAVKRSWRGVYDSKITKCNVAISLRAIMTNPGSHCPLALVTFEIWFFSKLFKAVPTCFCDCVNRTPKQPLPVSDFPLSVVDIMSNGVLHITDSRTSRDYHIPIRRNVIKAVDFQAIKGPVEDSDLADQVGNGLRLFDPGFKNTAVSESTITFMYVQHFC